MKKYAVVLLNLGGPDSLSAVRPFLYQLFRDPAIIRLPYFLREGLARFISWRRAFEAKKIYAHLGGKSPLLLNTQEQAKALEKHLAPSGRVFIAMRYWHPFTEETVDAVFDYGPNQVILLPLYPQFSTTTTASSVKCWIKKAEKKGLKCPVHVVGCYPAHSGFIEAVGELLEEALCKLPQGSHPYVLFSAHGLPQRIVDAGDPYPQHVVKTVEAVMNLETFQNRDLSYSLAYQSRVGPLKWIGPATDTEIQRLGSQGRDLVLVPISFVSEHSETLYELDIEYNNLAKNSGIKTFIRVPAAATHEKFIQGLADLCRQSFSEDFLLCPQKKQGVCLCEKALSYA